MKSTMNFNSFTLKNTKKKAKVLDDRPFNSIANINQGKQRIINSVNLEKTAKWVNCTYVAISGRGVGGFEQHKDVND